MFKKNVNTPDFWNQQFQDEWKFISTKQEKGFWRWDPVRFEAIASLIPRLDYSVLDVGCGLGYFVRFLKARLPFVYVEGCDFSDFAVEKTTQLGSHAFVSDCYSFSKEKKYNCVVGSEVIEHLSDPKKFLKECKKALLPNGMCIITTPIRERLIKAPDHITEFTVEELYQLMSKYFSDVKVVDYQNFQLAFGINK